MAKVKIIMLFLVGLLIVSFVSAETFGYGRTREQPINYSLVPSVNNSLFWDGNAYDIFRWLEIDGGNANQNIDIAPYNITAGSFIGDGSQLTGIQASAGNPFDQDLNTTDNVTFVSVFAEWGNFTELYTSNGTLTIGQVSISETNNTLIVEDNATLFADFLAGDGSGLYNLDLNNISFAGGNITAVNILASSFYGNTFYGSEFIGGNFTGFNFFGGDFHGTYDWTAEFPWLNFNGTYLEFNETKLQEETEVTLQESITTVVSSGGIATATTGIIDFEIKEIRVNTTSGTKFRFEAVEATNGNIIDKDRILHNTLWAIEKNYAIDDAVNFTISSAIPDDSFTITIKYLNNWD